MGPPGSRKRIHSAKKKHFRKYVLGTKHRARDIDQVHEDLVKRNMAPGEEPSEEVKPQEQEFDEDLPAGGRFYCVETARYFMSQDALDKHKKSKQYKKRVKQLMNEEIYTHSSAEAAIGVTKEVLPPVKRQREATMEE